MDSAYHHALPCHCARRSGRSRVPSSSSARSSRPATSSSWQRRGSGSSWTRPWTSWGSPTSFATSCRAMRSAISSPDRVPAVGASHGVLVGDTVHDVKSAARAGVPCIAVLTGGNGAAELTGAGAALVTPRRGPARGAVVVIALRAAVAAVLCDRRRRPPCPVRRWRGGARLLVPVSRYAACAAPAPGPAVALRRRSSARLRCRERQAPEAWPDAPTRPR